jgi:hypothetical protein
MSAKDGYAALEGIIERRYDTNGMKMFRWSHAIIGHRPIVVRVAHEQTFRTKKMTWMEPTPLLRSPKTHQEMKLRKRTTKRSFGKVSFHLLIETASSLVNSTLVAAGDDAEFSHARHQIITSSYYTFCFDVAPRSLRFCLIGGGEFTIPCSCK